MGCDGRMVCEIETVANQKMTPRLFIRFFLMICPPPDIRKPIVFLNFFKNHESENPEISTELSKNIEHLKNTFIRLIQSKNAGI